MFYLETRDKRGRLNNMQIVRLKDKLGTRQLPTAELLLDGVISHKVRLCVFVATERVRRSFIHTGQQCFQKLAEDRLTCQKLTKKYLHSFFLCEDI